MSNRGGELEIHSIRQMASRIVFDADWPEQMATLSGRPLLVADERLGDWIETVGQALGTNEVLRLALHEKTKSLETVSQVYQWLGAVNATRDCLIVAMGGGVTTDLVGYAAATYLRGITWAAIPTSLLAQVDAAIGGKVGVNSAWGKNLVGAFHLPGIVAVDAKFLSTLPLREWRAGLGEVMKSALIRGGWLYQTLGELDLDPGDLARWSPVVRETAAIKVELVNQDLYEDGPRMYLNLGHTAGHALETLLGYGALTHGEAVGLGTLVALRLSEEVCGLPETVRATVMAWMERWELPTRLPRIDFPEFYEQMLRDKKARQTGLTWVLLETVGKPTLVSNVDRNMVQSVVQELGS